MSWTCCFRGSAKGRCNDRKGIKTGFCARFVPVLCPFSRYGLRKLLK